MDNRSYKNIVDCLPHALLILDDELRVVRLNRSCEALLSKAEKGILGKDLSDIIPHKELRGQATAVLQNGGVKLVEIHLEQENPMILRATVTGLGSTGKSGNALCVVTLEDIGERARLEEQLVQSEKLAGMGLLASTIAHELGNPLSTMTSTLQYIRDTILDAGKPRQRDAGIVEAIEPIMDSVAEMHKLLRILSGFTGSQRPHFEPTDLRRVLSQMLAFVHKEAEAHEVKVHHQFDENVPDCQVDLREVKQLFLNLLKNAMEAMPDGGELRVRMRLAEDEGAVCIDVSDSGHGVSEIELRSIFRPFYSTKPDGTGLGLPFCRRVVEEHGGEIKVESKLNKGTVFRITLPIKQVDNQ